MKRCLKRASGHGLEGEPWSTEQIEPQQGAYLSVE